MAVTILSAGIPVELSDQIFSWDATGQVLGSAPYLIGSVASFTNRNDLTAPEYVWKTQRSVRTVVGFLARNVAQIRLHGFTWDEQNDPVRVDRSSELARLLKSPGLGKTTYFSFMRDQVQDVCLFDRHASLKVTDNRGVKCLVRLPPNRWRFDRDVTGRPVRLQWVHSDGSLVPYELDNLLWHDGYWGGIESSPMDSLVDLLFEQSESAKYRSELWQNGARMPGWIERPLTSPDWTKTARANFRGSWDAYAKDGVKAGRTPILEDGMQYHELQNGVTPKDGQQIEARKLSIAEVAAAFQCPPVFVGLLDSTSHSNVGAYREQLYSDVLGPSLQELQQTWTVQLQGWVFDDGDTAVEFNVGEKLRMSFEDQARVLQTAVGAPFMTRAEARRRMNLPFLAGTEELIVPLNVLEGGQASPTDSAPPNV